MKEKGRVITSVVYTGAHWRLRPHTGTIPSRHKEIKKLRREDNSK